MQGAGIKPYQVPSRPHSVGKNGSSIIKARHSNVKPSEDEVSAIDEPENRITKCLPSKRRTRGIRMDYAALDDDSGSDERQYEDSSGDYGSDVQYEVEAEDENMCADEEDAEAAGKCQSKPADKNVVSRRKRTATGPSMEAASSKRCRKTDPSHVKPLSNHVDPDTALPSIERSPMPQQKTSPPTIRPVRKFTTVPIKQQSPEAVADVISQTIGVTGLMVPILQDNYLGHSAA